jgi:hypothetical protein
MSNRIKFNRKLVEGIDYTIIDPSEIAKSRERIKIAMKPIINDFKRKERQSLISASKLIIK